MKHALIILLILSISACNQQTTQQLPASKAIAVVGDETVTADMLKAFFRANGISNPGEELAKKAFDALIDEVALANIAKNKKLQLNKEQLNTLNYLKIKSLANNAKTNYLNDNKITEEEIKKEYDQANKMVGGLEYRVHHLLYKDEVEAIKKREKIKTVADYLALEKKYLLENPNIKNTGDLGWVSLGQLPKEFSKALSNKPKDTVLKTIVNSQYGAHIVYLQDKRALKPPALEKVKAGIIQSLKAKKISKFIQLARAKSHIKVK